MHFGRGHYEEYFCEIIFEFGPVVQEMLFEKILSTALAAIFLLIETICAILIEGIMRNISVKLFGIWTIGLGDVI